MTVFNENFEKRISDSGKLRKDFLNSISLGELIENTTRKDATKVKNILTELKISNLTLGDINNNKKVLQQFANTLKNRTLADGSDAFVKPFIQSFGEIFKEAGYIPPKGTNPVRNLIKEVLGESQANQLFDVSITRKNPLAYETLDPYKALKKVATNLIKSNPDAGHHLLAMIQGGYRPSDFKSLRIENINFKTGEVVGLEIKDELDKAKMWLVSNKSYKKDLKKFCYNWISRATPNMVDEPVKSKKEIEKRNELAKAFKKMEQKYKNDRQ